VVQLKLEIKYERLLTLVTKEYFSFDEVDRKEYFVIEKSRQGLFTRENCKKVTIRKLSGG